jgi:uncharacterized surface protein with fasciclin (FAS1) repeats
VQSELLPQAFSLAEATCDLSKTKPTKSKTMKHILISLLSFACLTGLAFGDHHETKDIVDTAAGADDFKTLVAAVKAGGLVETLKGKGPFTVFAP